MLTATVAAIGNAGIPMRCFFHSASLLSGMGVSLALRVLTVFSHNNTKAT